MAKITLKGNQIKTVGKLPKIGKKAPKFKLVGNDLSVSKLKDFKGKNILLNITPSLDTGVCATSLRRFNEESAKMENTVIINVSKDLPFAQARFCGAEGIENAITLSAFRTKKFGKKYGVTIKTGPMKGLFSRAVVIINEKGKIVYTEQVPEIIVEPNYDAAIEVLQAAKNEKA